MVAFIYSRWRTRQTRQTLRFGDPRRRIVAAINCMTMAITWIAAAKTSAIMHP
jgi:hypothetical protein